MKRIVFSTILLLGLSPTWGFDQSHGLMTQIMKQVNKGGFINYNELKKNPSTLNQYLKSLASLSKSEFNKWSDSEKIAYYTNAYNAYTLKAIIDNYPIKSSFLKSALYPKNSIRQIDKVWDKKIYDVMGEKLSLNNIEHDILRKDFNEPRIHMALVCAAISCPPLREEAYTGEKLNDQLDDQSKVFLNGKHGFKLDAQKDTVYVSSIFKWFGEDFIKTYGKTNNFTDKSETERSVLNFVNSYLKPADNQYLTSAQYDLEYLKYDWTLNE